MSQEANIVLQLCEFAEMIQLMKKVLSSFYQDIFFHMEYIRLENDLNIKLVHLNKRLWENERAHLIGVEMKKRGCIRVGFWLLVCSETGQQKKLQRRFHGQS